MTKTVAEQPQNSIPKAQKAQEAILQSHDATRLINNNFHWILGVRPGHDGRFSIKNGWCDREVARTIPVSCPGRNYATSFARNISFFSGYIMKSRRSGNVGGTIAG